MVSRFCVVGLDAACILAASSATAQVQSPARTFSFQIPPGSLDQALRRYAKITGRQVLYRGEVVRGLRSAGLTGTMSAEDGLTRILAGTGLTPRSPARNVIVIQVASAPLTVTDGAELAGASSDIVVTGTNIRGASANSPVTIISRRDIQRSGKATVGEVVTSQPSNFSGTGNPVSVLSGTDRTGVNDTLATSPNLRGLGSEATLTLINGRRVAGAGARGDFTDLSSIPTLGVERVEILADGASAIYGSDAVAGVVNLIMRENLRGAEARLRASTGTRTGEKRYLVSAAAGTTWESGSLGLVYEYDHDDPLSSRDRAFTATGDLRPFGGTDRRTYLSAPATILTFDPVAGGFVPAFAVPSTGAATAAQLQPGVNFTYPLFGIDLSPRSDRHVVYGYANQRLGEVELHLDARYASRTFASTSSPQASIFAITAANPYFLSTDGAPFGVIGYSFVNELPNSRLRGRVDALSATGALNYRKAGWSFDAYATYAREHHRDRTDGLLNDTLLNEALGTTPDDPLTTFSTARDGFFNPYATGSANSATILRFIGQGFQRQERTSSLTEAGLKADGPLLTINGTDLRAAVGGTIRRESLRRDGETFFTGVAPQPGIARRADRTIKAAFLELNLPISGGPRGGRSDVGFDLSGAVRYERYPDFGSTTNPKVGLGWRPAPALRFFASWGTSFRAPALTDVNDPQIVAASQLPIASGAYTPVLVITGGNPALRPEKARTWNIGAILTPPAMSDLRLEANLFRTRFAQRIGRPVLQNILTALTDPYVAGFIERISPATSQSDLARVRALLAMPSAAGGGIFPDTAYTALIDARNVNTTTLTVSGMDGSFSIAPNLAGGKIQAGASLTWLFSYKQQLTPLSPARERLDRLGFPASLRANVTLGYSLGAFSGTLIGRYAGGYTDDVSTPARPVDSWLTADATLSVSPARGPLAGWGVNLVVENLFDRDPPLVDQTLGLGFDGANASPFGRTVALQIDAKF